MKAERDEPLAPAPREHSARGDPKADAIAAAAAIAGHGAGLPTRAGENPVALASENAIAVSPMRPPGPPRQYPARQRVMSLPLLSFLLMVALPAALAGIYYLFIAADQYVVEFRFGVRGVEAMPVGFGGFFSASLASSPIAFDSAAVVQYIESRTITDDLGGTLDLPRMFSRSQGDWLARLHPPVPAEELVRYWRGQVDAFYDETDRTITVKVRAFTPRDALVLARGVLSAAERLVNDLSARARHDTLAQAQKDLDKAEARLAGVLVRLRRFRNQEGVIDPRQTANATEARAGRLRDELVQAKAKLALLRHYMSDDAPELTILEAQIAALAAQERSVAGEITSVEQARAHILSRSMTSYEELESERHFAETAYQQALQALDRARREADRQRIYLVPFVKPSLPEESLYPRRPMAVGIVFLAAFAVWAIGSLVVQSIRDHL